jgi:HAMP domain-containing protein
MKRLPAIILTLILVILFFTSCGSKNPQDVLKSRMDALISGDFDAIDVAQMSLAEVELSKEEEAAQAKMWKALFGGMKYQIGESTIDGDKAKVEIKINTISMSTILSNYLVQAMSHMFDEKQWDADGQELLKLITDENAQRGDFTATVNMTKKSGSWTIDEENDEFYNALLGGIKDFADSLGGSNK